MLPENGATQAKYLVPYRSSAGMGGLTVPGMIRSVAIVVV